MEPKRRPAIPAYVTNAILVESGHRCAVCGEGCPLERAHIVPWGKTKEHTIENLICLCANCHQRADTEKWGKKILREYKSNPWIKNKFNETEMLSETAKIQIILDMELEEFDSTKQRLLSYALAAFLDIPPGQVKIEKINAGSVKVIISLPRKSANALMKARKEQNSSLEEYFAPLSVVQVASRGLTPSSSRGVAPVNAPRWQKKTREMRLFVGNLSSQILENDLQDYFSRAGVVSSVNLMLDKSTGKSRGVAFVEYSSPAEAEKAVQMFHGKEFQGRPLTVNIAARSRELPAPRSAHYREDRGERRERR